MPLDIVFAASPKAKEFLKERGFREQTVLIRQSQSNNVKHAEAKLFDLVREFCRRPGEFRDIGSDPPPPEGIFQFCSTDFWGAGPD